jgi:hypothetical protein
MKSLTKLVFVSIGLLTSAGMPGNPALSGKWTWDNNEGMAQASGVTLCFYNDCPACDPLNICSEGPIGCQILGEDPDNATCWDNLETGLWSYLVAGLCAGEDTFADGEITITGAEEDPIAITCDDVLFTTTTSSATSISTTSSSTSTTTTTLSGGCAPTALYGEDSEEVETLRQYRDEVLAGSPKGRMFIRLFYQLSPMVARRMEQDPEFRAQVKRFSDFVVEAIDGSGEG